MRLQLLAVVALVAAPVGARALGGGVRLRLGVAADAREITAFYGSNLGLAIPYTLAHVTRAIADFPTLVIVAEAVCDAAVGDDVCIVGCVMGRFDQLRCYAPDAVDGSCALDVDPVVVAVDGGARVEVPCAVVAYAGHVLSIAVAGPFLRLGIGAGLLSALHAQLKDEHAISRVSLHVRTANAAAIALYSSYDYEKSELLRDFYEEGGDAWLMTMQRELFGAREEL